MASHSELESTGERYVPSVRGRIELEHKHRYFMAQQLAKGKTVLDIACGEGYGTALLSEVADRVIGVDIEPTVVAHAAKKYQGKNITFVAGSCSGIPLISCSVDLVVSFETIEHDDDHTKMMAEIARVLKPEGILILSSPNKKEYSDIPHYANPYHKKELTFDELSTLLSQHFQNILVYGQRIIYGSLIAPINTNTKTEFCTYKKAGSSFHYMDGLDRPLYFIAIASKEERNLTILETSLLDEDLNQSEEILQREDALAAQRDTILQLECTIVQANHTINNLHGSRSWRITRPLRQVDHVLRKFGELPALWRDFWVQGEWRINGWNKLIATLKEHFKNKDREG
ncbi:MAG: class I SAM-dependent methyltransferase [Desulfuromonadaceae bacterium]